MTYPRTRRLGLIQRLRAWLLGDQQIHRPSEIAPRIFLTSDLHLDQKNIIRVCNRPFRNVRQMNYRLMQNWNATVKKNDTVYFLGDLVNAQDNTPTKEHLRHAQQYWLRKLTGKKVFILGNHDKPGPNGAHKKMIIEHKGIKFFLAHDPADVPKSWNGWVIAGHHHNHHPVDYPLINKNTKRINVSVEMTDYRPILLDRLVELIKT